MSLTYLTKCRVPGCKFTGSAPGLDGLFTGTLGANTVKTIMDGLLDHVRKNHPKVWESACVNTGLQLRNVLALRFFESQDPAAIEMLEFMRAQVHALTQKTQLSDSDIRGMVSKLGLKELEQPRVVALVCEIRDVLLEQGKHAPREPGASVVEGMQPQLVKP